jgi:O-antigen ligase
VLFADLCRRIEILIKKPKVSSAWPILWLVLLGVVLGLALLGPTPGLRLAFAVILFCLSLWAVIFARLEYATAAAVLCIPVHNYLTDLIFFGGQAPTGINVGTVWTGLMLLVFLVRYRSMPLDIRERKLLYMFLALIGFTLLAYIRGTEVDFSDWLLIFSGSARILCVVIWLRHAALVLPWTRSRWACTALGIGPIIVGCSMFGNAAIALIASSEQLFAIARNSGLNNPGIAADAAVMAMLFLCGSDVLAGKRIKLGLLLLPVAFIFPLLSGSRTGFFAVIVGSVILLYGRHNALLLSGALALGGAFSALKGFAPILYNRFTQLETGPGPGAGSGLLEVRSDVYANAWRAFLQHPLLGSGKDTYWRLSQTQLGAHNTLLAFLAEGGILYGLAFIIIIWRLLTLTSVCDRRWPVAGRAGMAIVAAYFVGSCGVLKSIVDSNSILLAGYIGYLLGGLRRSSVPAIRPNPMIHSKSLRIQAAASNPGFAEYGD